MQESSRILNNLRSIINWAIVFAIFIWFTIALLLSSINKHFFGAYKDKPTSLAGLPLFVAFIHNFQFFIISGIILSNSVKWLNYKTNKFFQRISKGRWYSTLEVVELVVPSVPGPKDYLKKFLPCAFFTALTRGLYQNSLRFLTLSTFTILKSSKPMFILLLAGYFGLERITKKTLIVILFMCVGLVLMGLQHKGDKVSIDTSHFAFYFGFTLAIFGTLCSAIRWGLTQMLIEEKINTNQKERDKGNLVELDNLNRRCDYEALCPKEEVIKLNQIHGCEKNSSSHSPTNSEKNIAHEEECNNYSFKRSNEKIGDIFSNMEHPKFIYIFFILTPTMGLLSLIGSLVFEHPLQSLPENPEISTFCSILLVLTTGMLAFVMNIAEYWIIQEKGVVFFSVCGVLREVLTLGVAAILFSDRYNTYTIAGVIVSFSSICYYHYMKTVK